MGYIASRTGSGCLNLHRVDLIKAKIRINRNRRECRPKKVVHNSGSFSVMILSMVLQTDMSWGEEGTPWAGGLLERRMNSIGRWKTDEE